MVRICGLPKAVLDRMRFFLRIFSCSGKQYKNKVLGVFLVFVLLPGTGDFYATINNTTSQQQQEFRPILTTMQLRLASCYGNHYTTIKQQSNNNKKHGQQEWRRLIADSCTITWTQVDFAL